MTSFDPQKSKSSSKFLSLVLRHQPELIGLTLDSQGWAKVEELLEKVSAAGHPLDKELLEHIVASSDKQRFAFSEDRSKIRANQGHSTQVDLGLQPVLPPEVLFHGTLEKFLPLIHKDGLLKMSRHHVHLSKDLATALQVGGRRGKPIVLRVNAQAMHAKGHEFFCSENGVWLTDLVPPQFIEFP